MTHLILDLDQTLIHTLSNAEAARLIRLDEKYYMGLLFHIHIDNVGYMIMKRPFLREFLIFCFQRFETVSVWTAATKKYAEKVVDEIFEDLPHPTHLWHRKMCKKDADGQLYKVLSDFARETGLDLSSLCIIDDNETTCIQNGDRAIPIPPWMPRADTHDEKKDTALQNICALFGLE